MQDSQNQIEILFETAVDYGKTSYELAKLKTLDKTSDVVSSLIPHLIVYSLLAFFLFFCSMGVALWLGEILEKTYYGFFVVGAFYFVAAFVILFVIYKRLKKHFYDSIIKKVLN